MRKVAAVFLFSLMLIACASSTDSLDTIEETFAGYDKGDDNGRSYLIGVLGSGMWLDLRPLCGYQMNCDLDISAGKKIKVEFSEINDGVYVTERINVID